MLLLHGNLWSLKASPPLRNFVGGPAVSPGQAPEGSVWLPPFALEAASSVDRLLLGK